MQWNDGTPIPASSADTLGFNTKIPDFSAVLPNNYYKMAITSTIYFFAGCLTDGTKGVGLVNADGSVDLIYDDKDKTWLAQDGMYPLNVFTLPIPNVVTQVGTPNVPNYDFTGTDDIKIYSLVRDFPDANKDLDGALAKLKTIDEGAEVNPAVASLNDVADATDNEKMMTPRMTLQAIKDWPCIPVYVPTGAPPTNYVYMWAIQDGQEGREPPPETRRTPPETREKQ
jgi:hypothetical protein